MSKYKHSFCHILETSSDADASNILPLFTGYRQKVYMGVSNIFFFCWLAATSAHGAT